MRQCYIQTFCRGSRDLIVNEISVFESISQWVEGNAAVQTNQAKTLMESACCTLISPADPVSKVGSDLACTRAYSTMLVLWILPPPIIGCYYNAPQCLPRGEFPLILPLTKLVQELSCNLRPSHADSAAPRASFLSLQNRQTIGSSEYRFPFMVRALLATWAISV